MEIRRTRHTIYHITYHLGWCPRYRRQVLSGRIAEWLDCLIRLKVAELDSGIITLQVQPDHGHLLAEFPPALVVPQSMHRPTGYTAYALPKDVPWAKCHRPAVRTRPYYVGTAEGVSSHTIRRYIEPQKDCRVQKER